MINSLEDLDKALKILRANGVFEFEFSGMKMKLGELPGLMGGQVTGAAQEQSDESVIPSQDELDRAVGMPAMGLDDPFLDYSAREPLSENTEAEG